MRGKIHLYCGDGKGKTTCAIGLGVRAAGSGKKVLLVQFLKDASGNERKILAAIPGFFLFPAPVTIKFTFHMNPQEKQEACCRCEQLLEDAIRQAKQDSIDVLILDEALAAVDAGVLAEESLCCAVQSKPEKLELVLTGRNPSGRLVLLADYVTEMKKIKHPYDKGEAAREGIEY